MPFTFSIANNTLLGSDIVYTIISHTISVVYDPIDVNDTNTLTSVVMVPQEPYVDNISTISITNGVDSCTLSGYFDMSIFDNYQVTYVDKGFSDKSSIPVTDILANIPDGKDIYNISVDDRLSVILNFAVTATVTDGTFETYYYTYEVIQSYNMIKNWTIDYFTNRYWV